MKPFRFGIVAGQAFDLASWTELARRAESLGYDTLVSPDPQSGLDPFTTLSAAAAVTTELHVGTFVAVDTLRDRRLLAWQSMSLHTLTGGRFELGLGTGRPQAAELARTLGEDFGTPGERLRRLAETVAHLKEDPARPPLLLAAGGPKMLKLAAREADIVTLAAPPRTTEAELKSFVDGFWAAAGNRDVDWGRICSPSATSRCRGWSGSSARACPNSPPEGRWPCSPVMSTGRPRCCDGGTRSWGFPTLRSTAAFWRSSRRWSRF